MTRITVILDQSLVEKAKKITGLKTTRAVLDYALKELVRHSRQKDIFRLKGEVEWEGDLSQMRKGRSF